MKTFIKSLFLVALITNAYSQKKPTQSFFGGDVGGGGDVVKINGKWVMRDRVDDTTTLCYHGSKNIENFPKSFDKVLDSLDSVNWYIARIYRQEIQKLFFCYGNAPLLEYVTENYNPIFVPFTWRNYTRKVATRVKSTVYVDGSIYYGTEDEEGMDDQARGDFFLHEISHSFMNPYDPMYQTHLMSFIKVLINHVENPYPADFFNLQVEMNQMALPANYELFNLFKDELKYAFNLENPVNLRVNEALKVKKIIPYLTQADQEIIRQLIGFHSNLPLKIKEGDTERVRKLLAEGASPNSFHEGKPLLVYAMEQKEQEIFQMLFLHKNFKISSQIMVALKKEENKEYLELILSHTKPEILSQKGFLENALETQDKIFVEKILTNKFIQEAYGNERIVKNIRNLFKTEEELLDFVDRSELPNEYIESFYDSALEKDEFVTIYGLLQSQFKKSLINRKNSVNETILYTAVRKDDAELLKFLLKAEGLDLNQTFEAGNTIAHVVVYYARYELLLLLLQTGKVDFSAVNEAGVSPLELATKHKKENDKAMEIYKLLKKVGN